ncbi:MAG: FdtA/QdtA family cupin domain-containing protein [Eubacterium sp.]|nr:FdtA/QdtA family cupin domain-containing protein [Eubacterium sp.]
MREQCRFIKLKTYLDKRGALIPFESEREIPFEIKRCFFIKPEGENTVRGDHANLCSEVIICVSGSCKIESDDGKEKKLFVLGSPDSALYIPPRMWKKIYDFSSDCILLVAADERFDETRVINSYEEYLSVLKSE